uniref:Uncharacterized protein n=1 Tax=Panagrolaimus sp. ES5 TaxID=591445 RepID=A0AC34FRF7_9BILA
MDIENNGILKMLRFAALGIREPQLIYGSKMDVFKKTEHAYHVSYPAYVYRFKLRNAKQELTTDALLMEKDQSMPKSINAEAWKKWKHIGGMAMHEHIDTALFLYCALN